MNQPSTMQFRVKHTTGYHYENGAAASFNEARMTPLNTSEQYVLRSRLEISPMPWTYEYRDYWGTTVTAFEVHDPHADLSVVSTSLVETRPSQATGQQVGWDELREHDDEFAEFLAQSEWVRPTDALAAEVDALKTASDTPTAFAEAVMARVHDHVEYVSGSTAVTTTAAEAWEAGRGVCQDIAHATIGALRAGRVPARYVSGYLHPSSDPEVGETVEGESHAWVEYWDGAWVGVDPTNQVAQGPRHVVVARGRDYADNPPLRGIFATSGESELFVSVEITRLS